MALGRAPSALPGISPTRGEISSFVAFANDPTKKASVTPAFLVYHQYIRHIQRSAKTSAIAKYRYAAAAYRSSFSRRQSSSSCSSER